MQLLGVRKLNNQEADSILEVIKQEETDNGKIFTLANGWELAIPLLTEPIKLPQTIEARRLA